MSSLSSLLAASMSHTSSPFCTPGQLIYGNSNRVNSIRTYKYQELKDQGNHKERSSKRYGPILSRYPIPFPLESFVHHNENSNREGDKDRLRVGIVRAA
mmetsp:Transcript_61383/g.68742  ORF Transcript_61383/g.68742 Transcript_61383/m.68742 type:complete len:99 (+) Transcript_61383:418-714(+)